MNHILVVDDEPSMLRYLQTVLELDSYRVSTASNGIEAVDKVQRDTMNAKQPFESRLAAAWNDRVHGEILGAGDHPRRRRRRQTHALLLVELGVLKGGEALDLVQEG